MNYVNLEIGDTALVEKNLRNGPVDISNCDSLSLMVFGLHSEPDNPPMEVPLYSGDLRFIFRFGTDNDACFDYSRLIYPEWNNCVTISHKALSDLMDAALTESGDSFINIQRGHNGSSGETLGIHASGGRLPDVSKIEWMALGVAHVGNVEGVNALSGEIWVNEMKRIGIK